jgi:indolepyruvate ferredoxin oxidoreductase
MHRLRGTPFDVFGYTNVRRTERALIGQYRALIEQALGELTQDNYELAVKLASLPDIIRGYEDIKLANVDRFWDEVGQLGYASSGTRTISPAMSSAGD